MTTTTPAVERCIAALRAIVSMAPRTTAQEHWFAEGGKALAALAPAAPERVERSCTCHPDDRPIGACREHYAATECQADAPAIPAGMVPWHGGDAAPEDWDRREPILALDGEWLPRTEQEPYIKWRSIIAYTPVARPAATAGEAMTVINPDEWEPCSPAYLAAGGSCTAPRVWHESTKNHWHPKIAALQSDRGEVERLRVEARKRLALVDGCLDCNTDDLRTARAIVDFVEGRW